MSALDRVRGASTTVVALAAALAVAVGVIVWLALGQRSDADDLDQARNRLEQAQARDEAGRSALDAAKAVLVQITTYSFEDGQHDFAWLDKIADQQLKDKLAPNVGALQKAIVDGRVTATGRVLDAADRVVSDDQVEVIAFVDQAIRDQASSDVKVEEQRVSMTMKLVAGQWLVSRLELLSGATASDIPTDGASPAPSEGATP